MDTNKLPMIIAFGITLILPVLSAEAQVQQLTLRIDGLACPFCAYGLEKKMKQLDGYESYKVLINEGKFIVGWRHGQRLDLPAVERAVKKAGFTLRGVKASMLGTVTKVDGRYLLRLPDPLKQRFYLYEAAARPSAEGKSTHAHEGTADGLTDARRKYLDLVIAEKKTVRIMGQVHSHKDAARPAAIDVERLEIVDSLQSVTGTMRVDKETEDKPASLEIVDRRTRRVIRVQPAKRADWRASYLALMTKTKLNTDKSRPFRVRIFGQFNAEPLLLHRWEPIQYGAKVVISVRELASARRSVEMMRTLDKVKDVLHIEADHQQDRIWVWTASEAPETDVLRKQIEAAGFKVTRMDVQRAADTDGGAKLED